LLLNALRGRFGYERVKLGTDAIDVLLCLIGFACDAAVACLQALCESTQARLRLLKLALQRLAFHGCFPLCCVKAPNLPDAIHYMIMSHPVAASQCARAPPYIPPAALPACPQ
jgi:hypothetical protein